MLRNEYSPLRCIASYSCGACGLLLMGNSSVKPRKQPQTPSAGAAALPDSYLCPAPHKRSSSHLTRRVKSEDAPVPAGAVILSQLTGMWKELCCCSEPMHSSQLFNSLGAIPLPWLLIWLGVMGGRGCPFFLFQLGTSNVSFSSVHLKPPIRIN